MRRPTRAKWERWERIRRENDERERREGTYCRITEGPSPDPKAALAALEAAREADQFERSVPLLVEDDEYILLERPDGKLIRARVIKPRRRFPSEG